MPVINTVLPLARLIVFPASVTVPMLPKGWNATSTSSKTEFNTWRAAAYQPGVGPEPDQYEHAVWN